jgi:hypothetical protein
MKQFIGLAAGVPAALLLFLGIGAREGRVMVASDTAISVEVKDAPVEDALAAALGTGREVDVDPAAMRRARPVTLSLRNVAPEDAARAIARKAGVPLTMEADTVSVGAADKAPSLEPPALDTQVFGQTRFLPNSDAAVRVVTRDARTDAPVRNADVVVTLMAAAQPGPNGRAGFATSVFRGRTDASGAANAAFRVPNLPAGSYTLGVTASALGERDHVNQGISITPSAQILLTTDKPMYQPGQVIHVRALALAAPGRTPVAGAEAVIEVADAKGNKVFKKREKTSVYGIVSADFQLATEVNMGAFKITASVGGASQEKTVNVERYVLPKFKVEFKPDRTWYRPGDTLTGVVSARYFFGKPVQGKVHISLSSFDAGFNQFAEVSGTLDETGHFRAEQKLPDFFAGLPLEQGNAFVKADIVVTDTADHEEKATASVPVAAQALKVTIVPESATAVPGVENRFYIITASPDGSPVKARFALGTGGGFSSRAATGETDESGIALASVTPGADDGSVFVSARDAQNNEGTAELPLNTDASGGAILLRADKALYKVGDTIRLTALSPQGMSAVYFDIVRDRQTVLTRTADLKDGRADLSIDLGNDLSGTLEIHAWRIGKDGNIRRDTRVVYVDPANDLRIAAKPDKETYLPGEQARVLFAVTGPDGRPRPAALGISIVDESVFALQDMQPGMEKVYFLLEKEILEPKYEIHGFSPGEIVRPLPMGIEGVRRQRAAGALFAALPRREEAVTRLAATYPSKVMRARERGYELVIRDAEAIRLAMNAYKTAHGGLPGLEGDILARLIAGGHLKRDATMDPWKRPYAISAVSASWNDGFTLRSDGPDGKPNTTDDIAVYVNLSVSAKDQQWRFRRERGLARGGLAVGAEMQEMVFDRAMPMAAMAPAMPGKAGVDRDLGIMFKGSEAKAETGAAAPARVREYFPETLLFQPSLITDANGKATLDVPMADSITTWRLSAVASSRTGSLGSVTAPMRVFQEFFVDINFPVQLTQGDEVSVPVSVYNYLPRAQDVTLTADKEGWFQLLDEPVKKVSLGPNEVKGVKYRIKATGLGFQKLTIRAQGTNRADAVRREVEIIPNGKRVEQAFNGRLTEDVAQTVRIPDDSVTGASNILVKVYPGVFSTVVEGMDSIFRMPFGCFEQTSSVTYPNVLVLDYLKRTKRITPEIRMKAEQYINLGYQRLLSFEVDGGGFSWFGNAPANKVLTAYGLQEFADMSAVWEVDQAVISRTQAWEAKQQNADGSWSPDANYIDEGLGPMWKSNLLATAYVTWGMAESKRVADGAPGSAGKGVNYLKTHQSEAQDAYAMAVVANAMVAAAPDDPATTSILDRLVKERIDDDKGFTHWKTAQATVTFAGGDSADIETTALAAYACIRAGKYPDVVGRALNWLISKRDPSGTWGTTQATILTLKALLAGQGAQVHKGTATIKVLVNGAEAGTVQVNPDNADVMQQVDCKPYVKPGENTVQLRVTGEGQMMYGITAWHYTPWDAERVAPKPLDIKVRYDRTQLAVNETLAAEVEITFNPRAIPIRAGQPGPDIRPLPRSANMVVVDLGIPPGFTVDQADLTGLVNDKTVTRFETTGRQIILYFEKIEAGKPVKFTVHMAAQYPLKAQTPKSVVYQYYDPEVRATAAPVGLQVTE